MTTSQVIYISGKTCTGKTTLSRSLSDQYGYPVVELDTIIDSLGSDKDSLYLEAYQGSITSNTVQMFIDAADNKLRQAIDRRGGVIVEGAIANPDILRRIIEPWESSFQFIYLHPVNLDVYSNRLTERFKGSTSTSRNGLPSLFWKKFTKTQLAKYYSDRLISDDIRKSILLYARDSMDVSSRRLAKFSEYFDNIDVREI